MTDMPNRTPEEDALHEVEEHEARLVTLLRANRRAPTPSFRGELRRKLMPIESGRGFRRLNRPRSVPRLIAGYALTGFLLLVMAGVGIAGAGPFAPT
jgi:hypothetical protein